MSTSKKFDWERYAKMYDSLNELRPYRQMHGDVLKQLRNARYPLLDAGCGTGNLTAKLACTQKNGVIGIDVSPGMIIRAQQKSTAVPFVLADLNRGLPFANGTFNTVVCINALYALQDPGYTLRELSRVLEESGRLIVVTPKYGYDNGLILKAHCRSTKPDSLWQKPHLSAIRERALTLEAIPEPVIAARILEVARLNRSILLQRSFKFFTANELSQLLRESGFTKPQIAETYACQNLLVTAMKGRTFNDS